MRQEEGREVARELIKGADVVIENFRPGRMEAWGMGYEQLSAEHPRLVMTRVSGFGQTGPYSERPGFGTVAETASGYAFLNGWPDTPPTAPPFGFADSIAGHLGRVRHLDGALPARAERPRLRGRRRALRAADVHPRRRRPQLHRERHDHAAPRQRLGRSVPARHLPGRRRRLALDRRLQPVDRPAPLRRHGPPRPQGRRALRHQRRADGQQRRRCSRSSSTG